MPALAARMVDARSFAGSATTAHPVARRPAHATSIILVDAATRAVSSTAVRAALAAGQEVAADVPEAVRHHIAQHQLYTSHASAPGAAAATTSSPAGRLHGQD
jgi:nicotinic acid mononucleotide adenylyltransferase